MREVGRQRLAVPRDKGWPLGSVGNGQGHVVHPPAFGSPADGTPVFSKMFLERRCLIRKSFSSRQNGPPSCSPFSVPQRTWIFHASHGTHQEAVTSSEPNLIPHPTQLHVLRHPRNCRRSILGPKQDTVALMSLRSCHLVKAPEGSSHELGAAFHLWLQGHPSLKGWPWSSRKNFLLVFHPHL